jgi:hypothetical protein
MTRSRHLHLAYNAAEENAGEAHHEGAEYLGAIYQSVMIRRMDGDIGGPERNPR